ncbi:sulfite exporter TauE/SafE family protein [Pseudomarimonas arenosa]|uniref:Sulfite exporter TauE/SafE family protein n=1 Tax=Pseudomarimonas arenosa TaxID=2774145 RepID=A0AAW3ZQB7_9GAMM|nr:sulfite exporter TauE/SafE family protein [Pseudomarimonas arenosa]MBD8527334.1 sulfite exporter TauE/SafE family protein [Pseudomarimonas arenosa]
MIDWLVIGGAFLSGLLGAFHCAAMCGGIATGVAAGFERSRAGQSALALNLGRIGGYALAGALAGGLGAGLVQISRLSALQHGMRILVGAVLVIAALRILAPRLSFGLGGMGSRLWLSLRPMTSAVLPATTVTRQLLLGALWGWLPCGLSATLLVAAWLSVDALQGALIMLSFGLGTWVTMLPLTYSGSRIGTLLRGGHRQTLAAVLLISGLVTATAPLLSQHAAIHQLLLALGCRSLIGP